MEKESPLFQRAVRERVRGLPDSRTNGSLTVAARCWWRFHQAAGWIGKKIENERAILQIDILGENRKEVRDKIGRAWDN